MTVSSVVQDMRLYDAIRIEDEESEQVVRGWLGQRGPNADLSRAVSEHMWFLRDRLSGLVVIVGPDEFVSYWATAEEREFDKLADMLVGSVTQVLDWQFYAPEGAPWGGGDPLWLDATDEAEARKEAKLAGSNLIRSRVTLVPDWVEQPA
jgi:hypothetical protein